MSSLAFEGVQEGLLGSQMTNEFEPVLHIVQARHRARAQIISSSTATDLEEVVSISGRFTVSF